MSSREPWCWSWHLVDPAVLPKVFQTTTEHGPYHCCSMVAAAEVCAAGYYIKTGGPSLSLSVQNLLNDVPKKYPDEINGVDEHLCASMNTSSSLKYIQSYGIAMAADLPYMGRKTDDVPKPNGLKLKINSFNLYNTGNASDQKPSLIDYWSPVENLGGELFMEKIQQRPLVGEFYMDKDRFEQTRDGVYANRRRERVQPLEKLVAHATLVTGLGHGANGQDPYYVCQNSFGPHWGLYGGYVKIAEQEFFNLYDVNVNPRLVR